MSKLKAALWAGVVAAVLNGLVLAAAGLVPLTVTHGGLLRYLAFATGLAAPKEVAFEPTFNLIVGVAAALIYAGFIESRLRGPAVLKGLICAAATWLLDAVYILPAVGEGFAGGRGLTAPGIAWSAAAHLLFFMVLARLYARLTRGPAIADPAFPE